MIGDEVIGVGYEGVSVERVVGDLMASCVAVLVDVRLTPLSRKPGFSKRALGSHLAAAGIDYVHLPALGNPKWNRPGFHGSETERDVARTNYRQGLESEAAVAALDQIRALAEREKVAVLCFEADEACCHRSMVIEAVRRLPMGHGRGGE